jgi:hypothetical protein
LAGSTLAQAALLCPRCLNDLPAGPAARFCPRCGLPGAREAALDTAPLDVSAGGRTYQVLDRLAIGSVSTVYRCRFVDGRRQVEGVFKVARDARGNALVADEADVLRKLQRRPEAPRFSPFLPSVEASLDVDGESGAPRRASVLRMHEAVRSVDELYTLKEVRGHYPAGLDARDVAWVWRRLLAVLQFVHGCEVTHAAVLPEHVLIEPREHKLLLVGWSGAVARGIDVRWDGAPVERPPKLVSGGYVAWYRRQGALHSPPTPPLDVALGARCMVELLGGDPVGLEFPPSVDPALRRYFTRCVDAAVLENGPGAGKLLDDFDRLIEALWGRRTFRPLALPPKPGDRA